MSPIQQEFVLERVPRQVFANFQMLTFQEKRSEQHRRNGFKLYHGGNARFTLTVPSNNDYPTWQRQGHTHPQPQPPDTWINEIITITTTSTSANEQLVVQHFQGHLGIHLGLVCLSNKWQSMIWSLCNPCRSRWFEMHSGEFRWMHWFPRTWLEFNVPYHLSHHRVFCQIRCQNNPW